MSKKHSETEEHKHEVAEEKEASAAAKTEHNEPVEASEKPTTSDTGGKNWFKKCWQWALSHKKFSIPIAVVVLLAALAAIPFTRYAIAGTFLKQTFSVTVLDIETGKPVSEADVKINGGSGVTNSDGKAQVRASVGYTNLEVSKKYYNSASQKTLVPIGKQDKPLEIKLKATGRAVPVTVLNKISKKPAANVTITAEGTDARTDDEGKTTLVVPADKTEVAAKLSGDGFNEIEVTLTVTSDEVEANTFSVTPSGKIYFLSNASGKIDLIKSDLDGANRQTVLAGTGKEDKYNTVLLASRDWKYIALLSKRDGGDYAKLFLIETANDKLTTMDEGEATFNLYGWSGDRLVYSVTREKVNYWEPKRQALKSYSASAKKITTLDQTAAEGSQHSFFSEQVEFVYVLSQEVAFVKRISRGLLEDYPDKQATFNTVKADGSQKKIVKGYEDFYLETRTANFGQIYILYEERRNDYNTRKVAKYRDGQINVTDEKVEDFYSETYPYYSVSPSGNKTLWSDYRDGKNIFFVGDAKGENEKEIGRADEHTTYGWFTDAYVLLTKKGSEMHILPADGIEGGLEEALKISDYYKPSYYPNGFGYGYGR